MKIDRRDFVQTTLMGAVATAFEAPLVEGAWDSGAVRHLLPAVSHDHLLLKASFRRTLSVPPRLKVGKRIVQGQQTDTEGQFFSFGISELKSNHPHQLELLDAQGRSLCDPWTISTFPHPSDHPSRFRLMIYTCAGGHDAMRNPDSGGPYWVPIAHRQKMLLTGLSHRPDAVIAVGDHVYWDLRSPKGSLNLGGSAIARKLVGEFDRATPLLGTANEGKLKLAVSPQICDLYGTLFRSTPVFFLQDDHDYFENDEATEEIVTFPPDDFMLRLARATQSLYYPEFLPDLNRPLGLPAASAPDRTPGVSESFGTLRYGKLLEILMYDCRRFLTLKGRAAGFLPDTVEAWLMRRMEAQETHHVVNLPSTPVGWSAGKWGEWYPDLLQPGGSLGTDQPKYFWQSGWRLQHDRLLAAASRMRRIPLFLSGDLHALAYGRILRNGCADLGRNPVVSVLTGPISTGPLAWPSAWRGTPPLVPTGLEVEEQLKPLEKNGFSIIDFTEDRIQIQFFGWKMGESEDSLERLKPFRHFSVERTI